jgi:hypothetical protein
LTEVFDGLREDELSVASKVMLNMMGNLEKLKEKNHDHKTE